MNLQCFGIYTQNHRCQRKISPKKAQTTPAPSSTIQPASQSGGRRAKLTSSPPRANSAIPRIIRSAPNIPNTSIKQPLSSKMLAIQMLNTPKATGRYRALLRIFGQLHGSSRLPVRVQRHATCGLCKGTEDAAEERGHGACHDDEEEECDGVGDYAVG